MSSNLLFIHRLLLPGTILASAISIVSNFGWYMSKIRSEGSDFEAQKFIKAIRSGRGTIQVGETTAKVAQILNDHTTRTKVLAEIFKTNETLLTQIHEAIQEKLDPKTPTTLFSKIFSWLKPFTKGSNERLSVIQAAINNVINAQHRISASASPTASTISTSASEPPSPSLTISTSVSEPPSSAPEEPPSSGMMPPPPPPLPTEAVLAQQRTKEVGELRAALGLRDGEKLKGPIEAEQKKLKNLNEELTKLERLSTQSLALKKELTHLEKIRSRLSSGIITHTASNQPIALSKENVTALLSILDSRYYTLQEQLRQIEQTDLVSAKENLDSVIANSEKRLRDLNRLVDLTRPSRTDSPSAISPSPSAPGKRIPGQDAPGQLANVADEFMAAMAKRQPAKFREKMEGEVEQIRAIAQNAQIEAKKAIAKYPQIAKIIQPLLDRATNAESAANFAKNQSTFVVNDVNQLLQNARDVEEQLQAAIAAEEAIRNAISDAKNVVPTAAPPPPVAGGIPPPPPPPSLVSSPASIKKPKTPSSVSPAPKEAGKTPDREQIVAIAYFKRLQKTLEENPQKALQTIAENLQLFE